MATLSAFADAARERERPITLTFTDLFEATDEETSAGFAYHLRELRGHYLEKVERDGDDAGYRLTDAGRRVVRALAAGAYTERVDREPVAVPEPCPLCGGDLRAATADNVVTVGCVDCDRDVCKLPFPPGGFASHDDAHDLLAAVDRLHRNRVRLLREGTCPDCGGGTTATVAVDAVEDAPDRAHAELACTACGERVRCPVTVALLDHPALVAFGQDHGEATVDRPVWNVGDAFSETVLSADPVCVRVGWRLDGEELAVLVGADCSVGHVERAEPEGSGDREGSAESAAV
jgi:DNA-binding transcriptional ArsR family regulator